MKPVIWIIALLALALGGCAGKEPETVYVPVVTAAPDYDWPVECVSPDDAPKRYKDADITKSDIVRKDDANEAQIAELKRKRSICRAAHIKAKKGQG